jgi:hypothetical protein
MLSGALQFFPVIWKVNVAATWAVVPVLRPPTLLPTMTQHKAQLLSGEERKTGKSLGEREGQYKGGRE